MAICGIWKPLPDARCRDDAPPSYSRPVPMGVSPLRAAVGKAHRQHGHRCVGLGRVDVQPIIFWEPVCLHASDEPGEESPLMFHGANKLLKLAVI
jgi:hypothetical protein